MKITDIYPLISDIGKKIIDENQPFKSGKLLFFDYGDYPHVLFSRESYNIKIKRDSKYFEITLLHEFFHCLQHEDNFPFLTKTDGTCDKFVNELSSVVLDLDVGDRLSYHNYDRFLNFKELSEAYTVILCYAKLTGDKSELLNINDNYNLSQFLAYLKYFNFNKDLQILLPLVKELIPQSYEFYKIFYKSFIMYSHNNPKGIYKLFKCLIKELKLEKCVKISH